MKRKIFTLLLLVLLLFSFGVPAMAQEATPVPFSASPSPQPSGESEMVTFDGTGDDVSSAFALEQGIAIFTISHDGESNISIELLDESGNPVDLLVNEIGAYNGSKAIGVRENNILGAKPGDHIMNISADGNWEVGIVQPQPPDAAEVLPLDVAGTGDSVSPYFTLNAGLTTFTMSHDGSENFIIQLISADGELADFLANEIGAYEGKKALGVQPNNILGASPGIHILSITADGNWKVSISH